MTARTALYLCSVTFISLMAAECREGTDVSGKLDWRGSTTEMAQFNISGGWTCSNGLTGPG
jgi:hypothetical protein